MQHSLFDIKERLVKALDKDNNVVDMVAVLEVISVLERTPVTKDALEKTRLGKYVNELRKKTSNENLARRAKDLVKSWRKLLTSDASVNGERQTLVAASPPVGVVTSGPGPGSGTSTASGPGPRHSGALVLPHNYKSVSPVVTSAEHVASPLCSSASCSPILSVPRPQGSNRAITPSSSGRNHEKVIPGRHSTGSIASPIGTLFKPISPASTKTSSKVHGFSNIPSHLKPQSPAVSPKLRNGSKPASPSTTLSKLRHRPGRPDERTAHPMRSDVLPSQSASVCPGSTHSSLDIAKTNAANKRLRKFDHQTSPPAKRHHGLSDETSYSSNQGITVLINGLDSSSLDGENFNLSNNNELSFDHLRLTRNLQPSTSNSPIPQCSTAGSAAPTPPPPKKKRGRKSKAEKLAEAAELKEKMISSTTQKVKTTQQLVAEVLGKNVSPSLVSTIATTATESRLIDSRRLGFPSHDSDTHKAKSVLMDRFLHSTATVTPPSPSITTSKPDVLPPCPSPTPGLFIQGTNDSEITDTVCETSYRDPINIEIEKILSELPPLEELAVEMDDSDDSDSEEETPLQVREVIVKESDLEKLSQPWVGVNGNYDKEGCWHEWDDVTTLPSLNDDVLHILPYVNIDW